MRNFTLSQKQKPHLLSESSSFIFIIHSWPISKKKINEHAFCDVQFDSKRRENEKRIPRDFYLALRRYLMIIAKIIVLK